MQSKIKSIMVPLLLLSLAASLICCALPTENTEPDEVNGLLSKTKIAFTSWRTGNPEVFVVNADGSNPINLTKHPNSDFAPCWSPDGTKLVFYSTRDGNREIYLMDADGSSPVRLTHNHYEERHPSWSPDGSRITFDSARNGNTDIFVMNVDGSDEIRLTTDSAYDGQPTWSPDGSKIVFYSMRDGDGDIYTINVDGSDLSKVTDNTVDDIQPSWSPDGSIIAFESSRNGNRDIYVINVDGTNEIRLTNNANDDRNPSWSPDVSMIAFMSDRDGDKEIYIMNVNGTSQRNLTNSSEDDYFPSWSPVISSIPGEDIGTGNVSGTWTLDNSPYIVGQDITIARDRTLTIEPGVIVKFTGHYKLNVRGTLLAVGTESDTIVFTVENNTGFNNHNVLDGGWNGIRFIETDNNEQNGSKIIYCRLEYGKAPIGEYDDNNQGGAIFCDNSSDLIIEHSLFWNNVAWNGGGIACVNNSHPIIEYCTLCNNYAYNHGGGIYFNHSSPTIRWNEIYSNESRGGQGGGISGEYSSTAIIERNLLCRNVAKPPPGASAYLGGGGMAFDDLCNPLVYNNTLDGNYATYGVGGGIFIDFSAYPVIKNNIITNCTQGEGIYVSFVGGDREISYNNVWNNSGGNFAGNITPDASNISLDPLYLDPVNGNYNLAGGSPCIDAGDPTLPQDPDGTIADIGAYYYHQSITIRRPSNVELFLSHYCTSAFVCSDSHSGIRFTRNRVREKIN